MKTGICSLLTITPRGDLLYKYKIDKNSFYYTKYHSLFERFYFSKSDKAAEHNEYFLPSNRLLLVQVKL